ncbi:MAG: hypothetical protein AAFX87_16050 [Bacteroidota bacterium]
MGSQFFKHFKLLLLLVSTGFLITACGGGQSENATEEKEAETVVDISEEYEEEIPEDEVKAPVFKQDMVDALNKLTYVDNWILEENSEGGDFSVFKDDNGFYRVRGLSPYEGAYFNDFDIPDEESGNYFAEIANAENDVIACYEFVITDARVHITYYEQCARARDRTTYINEDYLRQLETEAEKTLVSRLQFTYVGTVSGDFYMTMKDEEGQTVSFSGIDIKDFDMGDNPYFVADTTIESVMPQYIIREEVKEKWYNVSFQIRDIDIGNEEPEQAAFITDIEE